MFFKKGDPTMNEKINQMKAFHQTVDDSSVAVLNAIKQFKNEVEQNKKYSDSINKDVDKKCLGNFSTLSLTLDGSLFEDEETTQGLLEDLPRILAELKRDINLFKTEDTNQARQLIYANALELVDKINNQCVGNIENKGLAP